MSDKMTEIRTALPNDDADASPDASIQCPFTGVPFEHQGLVLRRRLNTAYVDDERNFITSCWACFADTWNLYEQQWIDSGMPHYRGEPPPDE